VVYGGLYQPCLLDPGQGLVFSVRGNKGGAKLSFFSGKPRISGRDRKELADEIQYEEQAKGNLEKAAV